MLKDVLPKIGNRAFFKAVFSKQDGERSLV